MFSDQWEVATLAGENESGSSWGIVSKPARSPAILKSDCHEASNILRSSLWLLRDVKFCQCGLTLIRTSNNSDTSDLVINSKQMAEWSGEDEVPIKIFWIIMLPYVPIYGNCSIAPECFSYYALCAISRTSTQVSTQDFVARVVRYGLKIMRIVMVRSDASQNNICDAKIHNEHSLSMRKQHLRITDQEWIRNNYDLT